MSTPTQMPTAFTAGETLNYTRTASEYPAPDWAIAVRLVGLEEVDADVAASGTAHVVTITAENTASLMPGVYRWVERATRAADNFVKDIGRGLITVRENPEIAASGNQQIALQRQITVLRAHLEGRLPTGMQSYVVAGRQVVKIDIERGWELLDRLEARLRRMVRGGTGAFGTDIKCYIGPIGNVP